MRKTVVTALLLTFFVPLAVAQKKPDLPLRYKKWLDEEIVYIITARERAVFLQLRTDKERDIFVEAFWKTARPLAGDAPERIRGGAQPPAETRQFLLRPVDAASRLADRPRPDLHHPRTAPKHRAVRLGQRGLPDRDLVLPRRPGPRPAHGLQRHLLQEGRRRRLRPVLADRARSPQPHRRFDGRLPGRHAHVVQHDERPGRL